LKTAYGHVISCFHKLSQTVSLVFMLVVVYKLKSLWK